MSLPSPLGSRAGPGVGGWRGAGGFTCNLTKLSACESGRWVEEARLMVHPLSPRDVWDAGYLLWWRNTPPGDGLIEGLVVFLSFYFLS